MKYGKYVNGQLEIFDKQYISVDGKRVFCPSAETLAKAGYYPMAELELKEAKEAMIAKIDEYDTSDAVNSFMLGEDMLWLPKSDRVGLMNSCQIEKAVGKEVTTLWFAGSSYTIPLDLAMQMLSALEIYALDCYNVTAKHKAEVEKLTTIEEVDSYDYTYGYPEKLNFAL